MSPRKRKTAITAGEYLAELEGVTMGWEKVLKEKYKDVLPVAPPGYSSPRQISERTKHKSVGGMQHTLDQLAVAGKIKRVKVRSGGARGWCWMYQD